MLSAKPHQTNRLETSSAFLPIRNQGDSQNNMETALKMTGALVLLIGAHLIFPQLTDLTLPLQKISNGYRGQVINISHEQEMSQPTNSQNLGNYEPPNFGAPESDRGSGTR